jgi:hypothetical protein
VLKPLRLAVFDRTCVARGVRPGLATAWRAGTVLYRGLGRIDAAFGAASWGEALAWLAAHAPDRPIGEIQYWGHGRWGRVLVADDVLDAQALREASHALRPRLEAVRERLTPDALVWMRTCEAFGAARGQDFARRLADFFGVRVAGHTYVIHVLQSGLHGLRPGAKPDWSPREGLAEGTPDAPVRAHESVPGAPRTVTCFTRAVPDEW